MGLSFFDNSIDSKIKETMVQRLNLDLDDDEWEIDGDYDDVDVVDVVQNGHRVIAKPEEIIRSYLTKKFSDFVTRNTINFFDRFKIPTGFLQEPTAQWSTNDSYKQGLVIVNQIRVVNDTAERLVKLMSDFIGYLTKDDREFQAIVTLMEDYSRAHRSLLKRDLMES